MPPAGPAFGLTALCFFAEPPRWTKKPQSAVYSSGSSGILLCEAEGEPQPKVVWRVNGGPVDGELRGFE